MDEAKEYTLFRDSFELIPERSAYALSRIALRFAIATCILFPLAGLVGLLRGAIWDPFTIAGFVIAGGTLLCARIIQSAFDARGWEEAVSGYTTVPDHHPDVAQVDPLHGYVIRNAGTPLLTPTQTQAAWQRAALQGAVDAPDHETDEAAEDLAPQESDVRGKLRGPFVGGVIRPIIVVALVVMAAVWIGYKSWAYFT